MEERIEVKIINKHGQQHLVKVPTAITVEATLDDDEVLSLYHMKNFNIITHVLFTNRLILI